MKVLDLFSGIGGFSLGLERAGMETIAFCEFDKHAQKVLKKHWPDIPIYEDVRTLDATKYRGTVDVVCGGFPCQDLSVAGKKAGFDGERSSLYREMLRIISECLPRYAIFENVTGLLTGESGRWFGQFLYDLASIGYDAEWHCIPASELGAHHHRDRVWIVVYPNLPQQKTGRLSERIQKEISIANCGSDSRSASEILADTLRGGQQRQGEPVKPINTKAKKAGKAIKPINGGIGEIWKTEPGMGRVVDGVWNRSYGHRLKQLGNAVVPQIPEAIGRAIMSAEGL